MIPEGTQFHGVAPSVVTKNLGSQQANSQRDVYTIEDFKTDTFSGTFINFGGGSPDVLGGDTVSWGVNPITQADHLGNIVITSKCIVSKISVKWSSVTNYQIAANGAQVNFKVSRCTDIGAPLVDASSWTDYINLDTVWDVSSGNYPGFIEDLSSQVDKVFNVGDIFSLTATTDQTFADSGEDVEATVVFQHVK
jgi:hypothetical protein